MAICKSATRYDSDSYYETEVNEANEDVTVRGIRNGEPVEYTLGSGGSGGLEYVKDAPDIFGDKSYSVIENNVEGENPNVAIGAYSHAEGVGTTASGYISHAEGSRTTASGSFSHVEGSNTTASGDTSHAEGNETVASGSYSHAEGVGTKANHKSQHVFGEYNVSDPSSANSYSRGTYVEIVGNGEDDSNRSNARTLDWSGNESLQGSLTLGKGTGDETTITATQLKALLAMLNA